VISLDFFYALAALSILAIVIAHTSVPVVISGGICIAISPCVIHRQLQLTKLKSLRNHINKIRGDVNRFREENEKLRRTIVDMEVQVER